MRHDERKQCKEIIHGTRAMAHASFGWERSIESLAIRHFLIYMIESLGEVFEKDIDSDEAEEILEEIFKKNTKRKEGVLFQIFNTLIGKDVLEEIESIGWEVASRFDTEKYI